MSIQRYRKSHLYGTAASLALCAASSLTRADYTDMGLPELQAFNPSINGSGITVAQPEATTYYNPNDPTGSLNLPYDPQYDQNNFEVSKLVSWGVAASIPITYINATGQTANAYPNTIGAESDHAGNVAALFYGVDGAAPNVAAVYNYNANYFLNNIIGNDTPIPAQVVNQSFIDIDPATDPNDAAIVDQYYDNYIESNGTIIVTAAGNSGGIQDPGTAYNVITVAAYDPNGGQTSSVGPTLDGRSKPDIAAIGDATSFTTPYVSGIATDLVQAGTAGIGNNPTESVTSIAIKALLLNGADKQPGWTHTTTQPLDVNTGAGIVNAYNSYLNLAAGFALPSARSQVPLGITTSTPTPTTYQHHLGWTVTTIFSHPNNDALNHFFLDLSDPAASYAFTATLTWDRPAGTITQTTDGNGNPETEVQITTPLNLNLYLVNLDTNTVTDESVSTIDNVQQLYDPTLAPGHYDVEVELTGNTSNAQSQLYSLAWRALATPSAQPGDINEDGVVNILDLQTLANNWQRTGADYTEGDLNGDGVVNILDLQILANNWQAGVGAGGGSGSSESLALMPLFSSLLNPTPEPGAISLLAIGTLTLLRRRKTTHGNP